MSFVKKYLEFFLLAALLAALLLKHFRIRVGDGLTILLAATVSFYYLASAILIFMDKQRVERLMRLMYFTGLWAVAFSVLAVVARIYLWEINEEMLIISISANIACLLFVLLQQLRIDKTELMSAFKREIRPLVIRSAAALLFCLIAYFSSEIMIYRYFGEYRDDPAYMELLQKKQDEGMRDSIREQLKEYKAGKHDYQRSTGTD